MKYELNGKPRESSIDPTELMRFSSKHGFVRTMERAHKNDFQALRLIHNAWARGKCARQLPTVQRKRISRFNSLLCGGCTNLRVYNGFLFIFAPDGPLITMHELPEGFDAKPIYHGKVRVRDAKKYYRLHQPSHDDTKEVRLS